MPTILLCIEFSYYSIVNTYLILQFAYISNHYVSWEHFAYISVLWPKNNVGRNKK